MPYVVTIIVLVVISFRKKKEDQHRKVWDRPISGRNDRKDIAWVIKQKQEKEHISDTPFGF